MAGLMNGSVFKHQHLMPQLHWYRLHTVPHHAEYSNEPTSSMKHAQLTEWLVAHAVNHNNGNLMTRSFPHRGDDFY